MKPIVYLLFLISTSLAQTVSTTTSMIQSDSKNCSNSLECWLPLTLRHFCCLDSKCQITNSICPDNDFVQANFKKCNATMGCFGKCGFAINNCCCINGACGLAINGSCPLD